MAGSFNKVILLGNLTRDPELRYTPQGTAVTDIGLAVNDRAKQGEQQRTTFVDVTVWDKGAEVICEYMRKGSSILVEGRLQTDSWEDRETGKRVYKLKVVAQTFQFTGSKNDNAGGGGSEDQANRGGGGNRGGYNNSNQGGYNRGASNNQNNNNYGGGGGGRPANNKPDNQYDNFDSGDFGGGGDDDIPF